MKLICKATFGYDIGIQTEEEIAFIKTSWRILNIVPKQWIEIPIDFIINNDSFSSFEFAIRRSHFVD
jgi:hypothetical protein